MPRVALVALIIGAFSLGGMFVAGRELGLLGLIGATGLGVAALAMAVHPVLVLAPYFAALFFGDTLLPGLPISANQILAVLFFLSVGAYWARGRTLWPQGALPWFLAGYALFLAASAFFGESAERGPLHARYAVIYFALALAVPLMLTTRRAILGFAAMIVIISAGFACHGLVEAVQKNAFEGFTGRWTDDQRVRGTAPNAIVYAWNMCYAFPFAFLLYSECRRRWHRGTALLLGTLAFFSTVFTFNRQTFLLMIVGAGLSGLLFVYRGRRAVLGLLTAGAIAVGVIALPLIVQRMLTVTSLNRDISFLERRDSYLVGMEMVAQHPVLGVGLGSFPGVWRNYLPADYSTYYIQYREANRPKFPDLGYIQILSETGFVGLGLYVGLAGWVLARAWRVRREGLRRGDTLAVNMAATVLVVMVHILLTTIIQDTLLYPRVWLLLGFALLLHPRTLGWAEKATEPDADALPLATIGPQSASDHS